MGVNNAETVIGTFGEVCTLALCKTVCVSGAEMLRGDRFTVESVTGAFPDGNQFRVRIFPDEAENVCVVTACETAVSGNDNQTGFALAELAIVNY